MKSLFRMYLSVLVPAFMLAGVAANPAIAQDKAKDAKMEMAAKGDKGKATNTVKVLHEDDRVRVTEGTSKPGEMSASVVRGKRVVRYLKGGTQERIYPDGKKEKVERKTGEVFVAGPDKQAYSVKNVGKTTIMTYTVNIKEAKK